MFLGIDLGTSSVKIVVIDDHQKIVSQSEKPLKISSPYPLWSEQDPHQWWKKTKEALFDLDCDRKKIQAIGLSGQMHGATLIGSQDEILRAAILWNDGRSMSQCHQIEKNVKEFATITANRVMAGFTAPKVLWVKENEPEIFKKIKKVLLPKDYLRLKLTGTYATDLSDASGTSWLNVQKRAWSDEMLSSTDLSEKHMPKLFEGNEITSKIHTKIAEELGFSQDTVVIAGGGDNAASAISMGIIEPGKSFLSLGTSGVYFTSTDVYKANPFGGVHTFCHCLPHLWHHMTVHLSSASCMDWLSKLLNTDLQKLFHIAEKADPQSPEIFLPYLSGERTPHNDPYIRGLFYHLGYQTEPKNLARATLEGVAFAFADGQDKIVDAGIAIGEVCVLGGGAKSFFWGKILASCLNRNLTYRSHANVGAAFGAARLAYLGKQGGDFKEILSMPKIEKEITADPKLVEIYQKKRKIFDKLYPALKDI